jgi:hypothetical protein
MQAVSVGMDLGLAYPSDEVGQGVGDPSDENKDFVEVEDDENHELVGDEKRLKEGSEKSKDGNLVRIVQTTDSSQVIGRDSVIVTVSGSNHTLWDPHHQQQAHNQTNVNNSHSASTNHLLQHCGPSDNNEVQILAHL